MKERIYAFLRNRSIYLRIYRTNLAVAILPLILLAVLFIVIYTSASMYWFGDTEEETLSHYAQSIASELYHFDNAIVGVAQDERTQDLLSRYLTMGDYERYEAQDQLTEMVLGELHMLDYVTDVALVTNNSAVIQIYNGPHDDFEIDAFDYATFVKKAFSAKTNTVLGDAASYARPDANPGNRNGFLYAKRVTDLKNNSVNIGYILAYLDKSAFFGQDIGASSGADDGTHRYIVDPGVRVVYASSNLSDSDARRLLSVLPDHIRAGLSSFFTRVSDGSPLPSLCTAYPVSEFGWYVVTVVPLWAFMSNVVTIVGLTLLLIALIAVLQWLLSSGISGSIDVPIRQIIQALHRIENGDFTEMTEDGFKDELSGVIHSLNYTCRLLDKLFKEAREHEFNKYELQLQAMQAQMNPHFVMNTLNSVILLADLQGADNIKAFCKALSRLMQNMLKGDTLYHTVREEISLLKDYALIMQYRYFDRFSVTYEVEVPEDTLLPRSMIQPLLENALLHGMDDKTPFMRVNIRFLARGDHFVVEVEDDGRGIPPERLAQLDEASLSTYEAIKKGANIGLRNIHQRIRLLSGDGYGLEVARDFRPGAKIMLRLPLTKEGDRLV